MLRYYLYKYILPWGTLVIILTIIIAMNLWLYRSIVKAEPMSVMINGIRSNSYRSNDRLYSSILPSTRFVGKPQIKKLVVKESSISITSFESKMIKLINKYRKDHKLSQLSIKDTDFSKVRQNQIKTDWSHDKFYLLSKKYFGNKLVGEILAKDWENANEIMNAWVNSPSHKEQLDYKGWSELSIGCSAQLCAVNFY